MAWVSGVPNWAQALAYKPISKNKPRTKNTCIVIILDPLADTPPALGFLNLLLTAQFTLKLY